MEEATGEIIIYQIYTAQRNRKHALVCERRKTVMYVTCSKNSIRAPNWIDFLITHRSFVRGHGPGLRRNFGAKMTIRYFSVDIKIWMLFTSYAALLTTFFHLVFSVSATNRLNYSKAPFESTATLKEMWARFNRCSSITGNPAPSPNSWQSGSSWGERQRDSDNDDEKTRPISIVITV